MSEYPKCFNVAEFLSESPPSERGSEIVDARRFDISSVPDMTNLDSTEKYKIFNEMLSRQMISPKLWVKDNREELFEQMRIDHNNNPNKTQAAVSSEPPPNPYGNYLELSPPVDSVSIPKDEPTPTPVEVKILDIYRSGIKVRLYFGKQPEKCLRHLKGLFTLLSKHMTQGNYKYVPWKLRSIIDIALRYEDEEASSLGRHWNEKSRHFNEIEELTTRMNQLVCIPELKPDLRLLSTVFQQLDKYNDDIFTLYEFERLKIQVTNFCAYEDHYQSVAIQYHNKWLDHYNNHFSVRFRHSLERMARGEET